MEQIESDTSAIATASYGTIIYSCIEILYSQKNYHIRICSDALLPFSVLEVIRSSQCGCC